MSARIAASEPGTCSLQLQLAVQMVVSLFGVLLETVEVHLSELKSILEGTVEIPMKVFEGYFCF